MQTARPFEAVICPESAHLNVDECGAPERIAGMKLYTVHAPAGKLTPELVEARLRSVRIGDQHAAQPRIVSISNATELGTVYTPGEVRALADLAHERGLLLHVDGARLANAAACLDVPLRALTTDAGADVVSFGGTKNGLLLGEAVIFIDPELAGGFRVRPQAVAPARVEDALRRRPVRRPAARRPVAPQRRPRERDGRAARTRG